MSVGFKIIDIYRGTQTKKEFNNIKREYASSYIRLQEIQNAKLIELMLFLKHHNLFYGKLLGKYSDSFITRHSVDIHQELPILTKQDIKREFNKIFTPVKQRKFEIHHTGGSTGDPFKYYIDKYSVSRLIAFNYYLWYRFLEYKLGDPILVIGGSAVGKHKGIISIYNFLQNKTFFPGDTFKIDGLIDKLHRSGVRPFKYLYGYPSSIGHLARSLEENDMKLFSGLRGIITTSEKLEDTMESSIRKGFKLPVLNIYGARDGGVMSGSIDNQMFYYNYVDCLVESIRFNEEYNELILTNLNSYTFPIVRYKVGDLGVVDIFKDQPVIKSFMGRTRDLIETTKGKIIHGSRFNKIIKKFEEIDQYQIIQKRDFSLEINVIIPGKQELKDVLLLESELHKLLDDTAIKIRIYINKKMRSTRNLKHKVIISEIQDRE